MNISKPDSNTYMYIYIYIYLYITCVQIAHWRCYLTDCVVWTYFYFKHLDIFNTIDDTGMYIFKLINNI